MSKRNDARMSTPRLSELTPASMLHDGLARLRASPVRLLAASALSLAAVAAFAAKPGLFGGGLTKGIAALSGASTGLFWIAGACFVVSLFASASTWRTTLEACGARLGVRDACARYGVGSLVNTVAPMRLGDAARLMLFSRTLDQEGGRALTAGGALGAIGLARAIVQAILLTVAAIVGTLPLWPVAALIGLASCGLLIGFLGRRRLPRRPVMHLLDAAHALTHSPRRAASLLGWTSVAAITRVIAATAIASSLGVPWSLGTGLIITAALDLATTIPLTPGNIGIASGAVALALQARGVPVATAVASGLAFHAVETAAGLVFGAVGAAVLAHYPTPRARLWALRLAGATGAALLVAGVGASVLPGVT
jgi:uncharacterized membrane protein YbhN (UPF0104 family)